MATIRKLRGRWQAQVRRRGLAPRARSFDTKADAERWARQLEAQVDRAGLLPDTRPAETTTLKQILERYRDCVSVTKRSSVSEVARINALLPQGHRSPHAGAALKQRSRDLSRSASKALGSKGSIPHSLGRSRKKQHSI